jgi:hypothetical protein
LDYITSLLPKRTDEHTNYNIQSNMALLIPKTNSSHQHVEGGTLSLWKQEIAQKTLRESS